MSAFSSQVCSAITGAAGTPESVNEGTPALINTAIANAITTYLIASTKIMVTFAGTISSIPPAPFTCPDVMTIVGMCAPIPTCPSFDLWVKAIETNIVTGFFWGPGNAGSVPMAPTPCFIPGLILTQAEVAAAHQGNIENPFQAVWEVICNKIVLWLTTTGTAPACPATHVSTAVGAVTLNTTQIL